MSKSAFVGSIYSAHPTCDCGGKYERVPHPMHGVLFPVCGDCHENAPRLRLWRKHGRSASYAISFDKSGKPLCSVEEAIKVAHQITKEMKNGTFDHREYLRKDGPGSIAEPVSAFINREVLKLYPAKDADPDYLYLRDFIAPYFVDVGVFAACEAHISFFIRDMGLIKNHQREYAKKLWNKVLEMARPQMSVA